MGTVKRLPRFTGNWEYRIQRLLGCGISYTGKRVLDAGCNVGILAYEIGKQRPALIHGIDFSEPAIFIARGIFLGYEFPSRFDALDMTELPALKAGLMPQYDIVIFMAVYQHILTRHGPEVARSVVEILASRCAETLVASANSSTAAELVSIAQSFGFDVCYDGDPEGVVFAFRRRGVEVRDVPTPQFDLAIRERLWKPGDADAWD